MKNATKLPPDQRKAVIVTSGIKVANKDGLSQVCFATVAKFCTMPTTARTVAHYFKIGELRKAIIADERTNQDVRDEAIAMGIK